MKATKENLKKFVLDWFEEIDSSGQMFHPDDVLHDLELQFDLIPKRKVSKTLMEVFAEEDAKCINDEVPF